MTVAELIAHLQTGEPTAEVMVFEHIGSPHKIDESFFVFQKRKPYGKSTSTKKEWYLSVRAVEIAPEPDD